jgi:oligoribonuclease
MPTTLGRVTNNAGERLVWLDCEMTGLDLAADELVEIACVVTEADLTPLDDGVSFVIKPSDAALAHMPEVVVAMHTESGLLPEIPHGVDVATAEAGVLEYVKHHVPTPRKAPLCGSSIYVDRMFLAKYMPALDAHLHYRVVDVSSLKELVRRWYPKIYYAAPEKTGNHRALGDTLDSIAELAYYRTAVMIGDDQA